LWIYSYSVYPDIVERHKHVHLYFWHSSLMTPGTKRVENLALL
jgi:hypothetical protein